MMKNGKEIQKHLKELRNKLFLKSAHKKSQMWVIGEPFNY
jgi:hypothetical protein